MCEIENVSPLFHLGSVCVGRQAFTGRFRGHSASLGRVVAQQPSPSSTGHYHGRPVIVGRIAAQYSRVPFSFSDLYFLHILIYIIPDYVQTRKIQNKFIRYSNCVKPILLCFTEHELYVKNEICTFSLHCYLCIFI